MFLELTILMITKMKDDNYYVKLCRYWYILDFYYCIDYSIMQWWNSWTIEIFNWRLSREIGCAVAAWLQAKVRQIRWSFTGHTSINRISFSLVITNERYDLSRACQLSIQMKYHEIRIVCDYREIIN